MSRDHVGNHVWSTKKDEGRVDHGSNNVTWKSCSESLVFCLRVLYLQENIITDLRTFRLHRFSPHCCAGLLQICVANLITRSIVWTVVCFVQFYGPWTAESKHLQLHRVCVCVCAHKNWWQLFFWGVCTDVIIRSISCIGHSLWWPGRARCLLSSVFQRSCSPLLNSGSGWRWKSSASAIPPIPLFLLSSAALSSLSLLSLSCVLSSYAEFLLFHLKLSISDR